MQAGVNALTGMAKNIYKYTTVLQKKKLLLKNDEGYANKLTDKINFSSSFFKPSYYLHNNISA